MPFPFRTKKTNLIVMNISTIISATLIIIIGAPHALNGLQKGNAHDALCLLGMLGFALLLYGINRIGLYLAYRERPTATPVDIEAARKMLYGDKE